MLQCLGNPHGNEVDVERTCDVEADRYLPYRFHVTRNGELTEYLDSLWVPRGTRRTAHCLLMPYHSFSVTKTARYFTAGPAIAEAKGVLIALHGYGQLPEFFMRRLQPLADAGWAIVAPEGLHRYYLEGAHGRVGASWMTKEAREDDIVDYVRTSTPFQLNSG